jgi:DNA-binding PucR family transcriptional regulator
MYIRVSDTLKLPSLKKSKIMAGSGGLDRKVYRISVVECPEFPINLDYAGEVNQLFKNGDFFISSLYAIRNNPELLIDTVKLYNQFNSSGIIIFDKYIAEIPVEVINYANNVNYPIILIENTIAYADIISDVMRAIFSQENNYNSISLIDKILNTELDERQLEKLAYSLNYSLDDYYCIISIEYDHAIEEKLNLLIHRLNTWNNIWAVRYYHSILIIISEENCFDKDLSKYINSISDTISKYTIDYNIGISDIFRSAQKIKLGINQSTDSCKVSKFLNKKVVYYDEIGTYKLLLAIKNNKILENYYYDLIEPIEKYDGKNNGDLLKTLISYCKFDGNLKNVSEEMHQHENTIRYRLKKIRKLVGYENKDLEFNENISIGYKIYKIINKNFK